MITLKVGRKNEPSTIPAPDVTSLASGKIRELLQQTGLLVTSLSFGGTAKDPIVFRQICKILVEEFSNGLVRRGYPSDIQHEALIAQCGLLDEMALRYLAADARTAWELHPMQVERFAIHDAGRRVIDRIEALLQETSPDIDLLECYASILDMGFVGRYAREGGAKRAATIAAIDSRLRTLRETIDEPFVTAAGGPPLSNRFTRLAPWIIALAAWIAAGVVWVVESRTLDAQVAPEKVIQP